jgi:hypothetical protein
MGWSGGNKYSSWLLQWRTNTDFNKATLTNTEVIGTGEDAYVQLEPLTDNDDDIPYTTAGNYTLSDGAKLEVSGDNAQLKAVSGSDTNWPFTTAGNYTYDSGKIDVTGGVATLKGITGIYAQWHMNESSGTTVSDSGPNSYNGTTQNMEDADWVAAKLNNGLRFDGVNEYVDCGNIADFERTDAFSVEAWVKTSTASKIIAARHNGTRGWFVFVNNTGLIYFNLSNNYGPNHLYRKSSGSVTDGSWHHVVCTYDGSEDVSGCHVYIDGDNDDGDSANTLTGTISTGVNMRLGAWNTGLYFNGDLDEVLVYEKEISASDVTDRYNSGSGTEEEGVDENDPTIYPNTGLAFTTALNTFTETATTPTGTSLRYHCSSDNGSTWKYWNGAAWAVTDDTYAQANTAADVHTNIGSLASSGTFKFRALLRSDGSNNLELDNIFISEPITYSTTDNLYIDTKDASQIAPTTILDWLTTTISNTNPANTDIRVLFSTDGRSNWQTYTGGSWQAPASSTTRTDATSITDAQTNFSSLGLGSGTLDVRLFLYTSDNSVRPIVSNINVTSDTGLPASGTWESNEYDGTYIDNNWEKWFSTLTLAGSSTITFQARASNVSGSLGSYSTLTDGEDSGITGRYLQILATLTADGQNNPRLESHSIEFSEPKVIKLAP